MSVSPTPEEAAALFADLRAAGEERNPDALNRDEFRELTTDAAYAEYREVADYAHSLLVALRDAREALKAVRLWPLSTEPIPPDDLRRAAELAQERGWKDIPGDPDPLRAAVERAEQAERERDQLIEQVTQGRAGEREQAENVALRRERDQAREEIAWLREMLTQAEQERDQAREALAAVRTYVVGLGVTLPVDLRNVT